MGVGTEFPDLPVSSAHLPSNSPVTSWEPGAGEGGGSASELSPRARPALASSFQRQCPGQLTDLPLLNCAQHAEKEGVRLWVERANSPPAAFCTEFAHAQTDTPSRLGT